MDATKSSRSFRSSMLRSVITLRKRTMKDVKGHNIIDLDKLEQLSLSQGLVSLPSHVLKLELRTHEFCLLAATVMDLHGRSCSLQRKLLSIGSFRHGSIDKRE